MSIQDEILRIQTDKNTIRTKLVNLGLVQSTADLDDIAAAVEGIDNRGAVSVEILEGNTYTIPAGYHNGSGTVKAMTDTTGDAEKYKTQAKTVTPTKKQQNIVPDSGHYALSAVTVEAIPENYQDVSSVTAAAGDVLANKIIVDKTGKQIAGTMLDHSDMTNISLYPDYDNYTIPEGYHSGDYKVKVLSTTSMAIPSKETQVIKAGVSSDFVTEQGGNHVSPFLSEVTVYPIPDKYQDVSNVTAQGNHVLKGEVFVDADGFEVTGSMDNVGKVTETLDTNTKTYQIPWGFHDGFGTVSVAEETKTVTPTKSKQTVKGDDHKFLSSVTVEPIPSTYHDVSGVTATAEKVLTGSAFVNADGTVVNGTMPDNSSKSMVGRVHADAVRFTLPKGYYDGSQFVMAVSQGGKTVTPTKEVQTITGDSGKEGDFSYTMFLRDVKINPIPDAYQDITGVTATAPDVLSGKKIVGSDGVVATGTMANNGGMTKTFDGLATTSVTIPAGYTTGGTVSLTNDIETALAAI